MDSKFTWNMCLTSPTRAHLEGMSTSGDSSLASSSSTSATPSTDKNKTPSVNHADITNSKDVKTSPDSRTDSSVIQLSSSSSDFELQEHTMPPPLSSSAISESIENMTRQREVTSFGAISLDEEVSELSKKDNAKSAFEITSVRLANTDDHERSGARNPVSNDSLRVVLPGKGESGESEDSIVMTDDALLGLTTSLEGSMMQAEVHFVVGADTAQDDEQAKNEIRSESNSNVTPGPNVPSLGTATLPEDLTTGGALAHPVNSAVTSSSGGGGVGAVAMAVNGSGVQPNRFRRVNQYERGRWTVRDSLVTEEQAETTTTSAPPTQLARPLQQQQEQSNSDITSNGTPPRTMNQLQRVELTTDPTHIQTSTELGMLPGIRGGGFDATSDKDSSSVHMDRSSTAAETLSRNTSMSSIIAPEKSVDGDEILHDSEVDSVSGGGGGAILNSVQSNEQELSDTPTTALTQPPVLLTLSVGAVPPPSLTAIPREEQQPPLQVTTSGESGKDSNYE